MTDVEPLKKSSSKFEFFQDWSPQKLEANFVLIRKSLAEGKPAFRHIIHPNLRFVYDKIILNKEKTLGIYGARKVSKTFTLTVALFEICLMIPGFKWVHAFPSLSTGRGTAFDIWYQLIPLLPPEMRPRVWRSSNILAFPNGSSIKLFGADPDSLNNQRSGRADGLLCDEVCFWDAERFQDAVTGIFIPMMGFSDYRYTYYATTVADDPKHPSLTTIMPRLMAQNKWFTFDIYKSPKYSEEYRLEKIEECGGENSIQYRREYLCELIGADDLIIMSAFDEKKHIKPCFDPIPFITGDQFYRDGGIIVDTAGDGINSDFMGMLLWRYDHDRDKLCIVDEWLGKKKDLEQMYSVMDNELLPRLKCVKNPRETIDCFNEIATEIRKTGRVFTTASAYKVKVEKQILAVNTTFSLDKIEIDPRCVKLIEQCKWGLWKIRENTKTFSKTKEYGHLDLLSCLCYVQRVCRWGQVPNNQVNLDLRGFSDCQTPQSFSDNSSKDTLSNLYESMGIKKNVTANANPFGFKRFP